MKFFEKKWLLFFIAICTIFLNVSSAKALGQIGQRGMARLGADPGFHKYFIKVNGSDSRVFCINYNIWDPTGEEYEAISALDLIKGMKADYWVRNFTDSKINEYIKMMGGIKYYYTDIKKVDMNSKNGANTVQAAIWKVLYDAGLEKCNRSNCDSWLLGTQFNYINNTYSDAKSWYDANEGNLEVKAIGWRIVNDNPSQPRQEIIELEVKYNNYVDYSLDSACVGCDTSTKSGTSYIVQDVDNWDMLKDVAKLDNAGNNKTIKNYFTKNVSDHICREQYQIFFPSSSDSKVTVKRGSYFTINEAAEFPNFEPFRIERVIQCIKNDGTEGDLSKLKDVYCKNGSKGDSGKIKIWYNEKKEAGFVYDPYSLDWTDLRKVDSDCSATKTNNGLAMIKMSSDYKLPEDTYRYIKNGSNRSLVSSSGISNTSLKQDYTATLVPNLPVALNHKVTRNDTVGGYISLKFDFADNSNMKTAFNDTNNQYLKVNGQANMDDSNIYKKWKDNPTKVENDAKDRVTIRNSACSKMYGFKTTDFNKCAGERDTIKKKIDICKQKNTVNINRNSTSKDGYTCPIYLNPDGNDLCRIVHLDRDEYGVFILKDGTETTDRNKFINQCCDIDNHNKLGVDWNPKTNSCCPAGSSYDVNTGKCENIRCTKDNVGKKGNGFDFTGYIWTKIVDETGESGDENGYGCCSFENYASGKCSSKPKCVDGVNGTCGGDAKTCVCTSDGLCPEEHLNSACPSSGVCRKDGGKYYMGGKEISATKYARECCNQSNHADSDINRDWNAYGGFCCEPGEVYIANTGECGPKDACTECSDASLCCGRGHKYRCGVKAGGSLICDDGKVFADELVYRTIDLGTPFVGAQGNNRITGSNWAYKTADNMSIDSSSDNDLVTSIIKKDNEVYNENHVLYRFTLDSASIDKIRKYNRNQKSGYSDFTLKCNKGNDCKSEVFVRNKEYFSEYSGICLGDSNSNEYKKYCK